MERIEYKKIVDKHTPNNKNKVRNASIAFIIGGLMGVLGNFLVDAYSYYFDLTANFEELYDYLQANFE